jgi:predicted nucleic acid-binding protein
MTYAATPIALMSKGRRQRALAAAFERVLAEDLDNRVLDFDGSAAVEAAGFAARRQKSARPVDMRGTQIA